MRTCIRACVRWLYADDVPYFVVYGWFALLSLAGFWVKFAGYHDSVIETSSVRTSITSIENKVASAVQLALVTPLTIDMGIDLIFSFLVNRNEPKEADVFGYFERTFVYLGYFIFPCCAFLDQQHYPNLALLTLCCSIFQWTIVWGGGLITFMRTSKTCFPAKLVMACLTFESLSMNLIAFTYVESGPPNDTIINLCNFCYYFGYLFLAWMTFHWLIVKLWSPYCSCCSVGNARRTQQLDAATVTTPPVGSVGEDEERLPVLDNDVSRPDRDNQSLDPQSQLHPSMKLKNEMLATSNVFSSFLLLFTLIAVILLVTDTTHFPDQQPMGLARMNIAFSIMTLGILNYHLRKYRTEATMRMHALVNRKASLLQYVRELYEPISTIYQAQKQMVEEMGETDSMVADTLHKVEVQTL